MVCLPFLNLRHRFFTAGNGPNMGIYSLQQFGSHDALIFIIIHNHGGPKVTLRTD